MIKIEIKATSEEGKKYNLSMKPCYVSEEVLDRIDKWLTDLDNEDDKLKVTISKVKQYKSYYGMSRKAHIIIYFSMTLMSHI